MLVYRVIKETLSLSDSGSYVCFGLAAVEMSDGEEREVCRVSDLCLKSSQAVRLALLCNSMQLSPTHLYDVAEDFLD